MRTNPAPSGQRRIAALLLLALAVGARLAGQSAIMAPPTEELNPESVRQAKQQSQPPSVSRPADAGETPFKAGPVAVRPRLLYRYLNAEGLPFGNRRIASEIKTITPGIEVDLGNHWSADYSPTWTYYTARALRDTVDQSAGLKGTASGERWNLNFSESFNLAAPTLVETAQQTKERIWATALAGTYDFDSHLGAAVNASLNEHYGDLFPDTREWSTENWLTVHLSNHLTVALGPGAGYVEIVGRPDMTYERYLARIDWQANARLFVNLKGGVENRHSRATNGKDMSSPLLEFAVDYLPFEPTRIALAYSQTVQNSYFQDQVTRSSSWSARLEQRLLGHLYTSVSWTHQETKYASTTALVAIPTESTNSGNAEDGSSAEPVDPETTLLLVSLPGRHDRVDSLGARLTFRFLRRLGFSATFQKSKNRSSDSGFSFSTTQYGFELTCQY